MNETYLVTGGAGHLGINVVDKLLSLNKKVRVLVFNKNKNLPKNKNLEIFKGDVRDKSTLTEFFNVKNAIVIHCAGIVTIQSKMNQNLYDTNVTGTKNIVDLCIENKVKKLIYVSSVHAMPEVEIGKAITETKEFDKDVVVDPYAQTKAEATAYVLSKANELNLCIVHPSGIIGPKDYGKGHITQMIIDISKKRLPAIIKGGYDFVDVRDVADGIVKCAEKGRNGECYLLTGGYYDVKTLVAKTCKIVGNKPIKLVLPLWFMNFVAPIMGVYYKVMKQAPLFTRYSIYTLNTNANFSSEKAKKELGYKSRPIDETLKDTYEWLKKEGRA